MIIYMFDDKSHSSSATALAELCYQDITKAVLIGSTCFNNLSGEPIKRISFLGHAGPNIFGSASHPLSGENSKGYTPEQFVNHLIEVCKLPKTVQEIDLLGCEIGFIQEGQSYVAIFTRLLADGGYDIRVNAFTNINFKGANLARMMLSVDPSRGNIKISGWDAEHQNKLSALVKTEATIEENINKIDEQHTDLIKQQKSNQTEVQLMLGAGNHLSSETELSNKIAKLESEKEQRDSLDLLGDKLFVSEPTMRQLVLLNNARQQHLDEQRVILAQLPPLANREFTGHDITYHALKAINKKLMEIDSQFEQELTRFNKIRQQLLEQQKTILVELSALATKEFSGDEVVYHVLETINEKIHQLDRVISPTGILNKYLLRTSAQINQDLMALYKIRDQLKEIYSLKIQLIKLTTKMTDLDKELQQNKELQNKIRNQFVLLHTFDFRNALDMYPDQFQFTAGKATKVKALENRSPSGVRRLGWQTFNEESKVPYHDGRLHHINIDTTNPSEITFKPIPGDWHHFNDAYAFPYDKGLFGQKSNQQLSSHGLEKDESEILEDKSYRVARPK